jgi:hypothetical protein
MSVSDFLLAFVGIIIGLGVADLLTSLHRLLRAGRRVKWHWATPTLAVLMLLVTLVVWFRSFGALGGLRSETVAEFLPGFVVLVFCFLMMAAALPDDVPDSGIDLKQYYLSSRTHLWALMSATLGGFTILYFVEHWSAGLVPLLAFAWPTLISLFLTIVATFSKRMSIHVLAIVWIFTVMVVRNLQVTIGQ